jgi:hypothetical protein
MVRPVHLLICLVALNASPAAYSEQPAAGNRLAKQLAPFLECIGGERESFTLSANIKLVDGAKTHQVTARIAKIDAASFDVDIRHPDYWLKLYRRHDRIVMILPLHNTAFVGAGPATEGDLLRPEGIASRMITPGTSVAIYLPMLWASDPQVLVSALPSLLQLQPDEKADRYTIAKSAAIEFAADSASFQVQWNESSADVQLSDDVQPADVAAEIAAAKVVPIERSEIERTFFRGVRRALEVLAPSPALTMPGQRQRTVPHGELRWIDGQRVVLLQGTPEQIGRAHGQLLKTETLRCMDSVIHMFAIARTIESGRWFRSDLDAAYQRLQPHIPEDHQREIDALADEIGWDQQLLRVVNVFPELFHCSGFAVFGSATSDGKLYHGRVLDYMTTIGLQDSATTFIVAVDGKIPFANVGYAGFVGSVSGMNDRGVSLGEMGGRGEGAWDGVPMATLMRRALEECSTLAEVKSLWTRSPRTCEYYYVFADGKTNEAVGVAATPDSLEFINPGAAHPLLGAGIDDAVVLSAGDRLQTLRDRVQQHHGKIDRETAQWLMSRPVAMQSNLHNVLFVPADGVMYVANADHKSPAAERPYVKIDLRTLIKAMNPAAPNLLTSGAE